jgi:DoxX-like family
MFAATVVVTSGLAALLAFAAIRKLSHQEAVVQSYVRVGVPPDKLDYLAYVLLAGAAGLVLGLFWAPIGVAAGAGVVCYFVLAVAAHIRHHDERNLPTPLVIEALAIAALTLRVATL